MSDNNALKMWYKNGLEFKCTGCGKCCTGSPGYVFLNKKEAEIIAQKLNLPLNDFLKKYTRQSGKRLALKERKISDTTYDCIFLKDNKCTIYEERPTQCKTYPWWPQNLKSPDSWKELAKECEGLYHEDAPLVSFEEIQLELEKN